MPISKTHAKKSPTQNPASFYKMENRSFGGPEGKSTQKVGDKLTGGPMREKIMGKKSLSR
jgi:hypothetical protein